MFWDLLGSGVLSEGHGFRGFRALGCRDVQAWRL